MLNDSITKNIIMFYARSTIVGRRFSTFNFGKYSPDLANIIKNQHPAQLAKLFCCTKQTQCVLDVLQMIPADYTIGKLMENPLGVFEHINSEELKQQADIILVIMKAAVKQDDVFLNTVCDKIPISPITLIYNIIHLCINYDSNTSPHDIIQNLYLLNILCIIYHFGSPKLAVGHILSNSKDSVNFIVKNYGIEYKGPITPNGDVNNASIHIRPDRETKAAKITIDIVMPPISDDDYEINKIISKISQVITEHE